MNENTLNELLEGLEWKDLELKSSQTDLPESVYDTVAAFLNTEGGHIVLGVNDEKEIVGVIDVDKVQNAFIGQLHGSEKFGRPIYFQDYLRQYENKNVLIFYIPEANRKDKPVYLRTRRHGRVAYIRKGACDCICNELDLNRMINDAKQDRPDGQLLDIDPDTCFDPNSVKWFRGRYENKGRDRSLSHLSDNDFLTELGLLAENRGQLLPTLASILLLGKSSRIRQFVPRPIVDCLWYGFDQDHANTGKRWEKRVTCELNIVESWQAIVDWYNSFSAASFTVDRETGQRSDSPPDFIAFRESVINLLSHQDFTDTTRWPIIENFADLTRFWNPGDAFASTDKLLEPGTKEVRNPIIVRALRDIGFSEQSGWGLREVYRNWNELGRVPPVLTNDKAEKSFELRLVRKALMSEQQILLQSQIGIHLSLQEAAAFANICAVENAKMSVSALRAALGLNGAETNKIIQRLVVQGVVTRPQDNLIELAEHLIGLRNKLLGVVQIEVAQATTSGPNLSTEQVAASTTNLSTEQVAASTTNLSTEQVAPLSSLNVNQRAILIFCDVPRTMADLMTHLNIGSRGYFKTKHLDPLLIHGFLKLTNPEKPTASNQRYVITELGVQMKQTISENKTE